MTQNLISWQTAAATAARLAPAGPRLSRREAGQAVESIRYQAGASVDHVHRITGLAAARNLHDSEVLVVDRAGWSRANAQTFAMMLNTLLEEGLTERIQDMSALDRRVTGTGGALELGGVLAFLSGKVLGQYDPFAALGGHGAAGGRLLLVAPNMVMLERELNLEPEDFRLWVCLHEQTHRVQFAAAPWLREHMLGLISRLPQNLSWGGQELVGRLLDGAGQAVRSLGGRPGNHSGVQTAAEGPHGEAGTQEAGPRAAGSALGPDAEEKPVPRHPMAALLDAESAEVLSELTAIMSLMEGHANVVMDAVDAGIVPTVKTIRRRFDARPRKGFADQILRRALGLDAKMRQYRDGQEFVRAVVRDRGMEQFNRIWERSEHLPTEREIHNPDHWIARVLDAVPGALDAPSGRDS